MEQQGCASMRFVAVKDEARQAAALVFRTREPAVKQRTQLGNAIREHVAGYGSRPRERLTSQC